MPEKNELTRTDLEGKWGTGQRTGAGALVAIEQQRAIQEVQAAIIIAKKFPRDVDEAYTRIMKACERKTLAECAMYAYPRGGQMVTGPSIRLAETIAQNYGNMQFGIRELSQENGESEVEAYAWDVETNTRQVKVFRVPHVRHTRKGQYSLSDPRDIYEMVANQGARRLRACILGIIPGDIIDAAVQQCEKTLHTQSGVPLQDRIRKMLVEFERFGVDKKMIETKLGHKSGAIVEQELVDLIKIFTSMRDGMSKREDWFDIPTVRTSEESDNLTDQVQQQAAAQQEEKEKPDPKKTEETPGKSEETEQPTVSPWHQGNWHTAKGPGMKRLADEHGATFHLETEGLRDAFEAKWKICKGLEELQFPFDGQGNWIGYEQEAAGEEPETETNNTILERYNEIMVSGDQAVVNAVNQTLGYEGRCPGDQVETWLTYYDNVLKNRVPAGGEEKAPEDLF